MSRSAGTQPDQKIRIRQLVSSTILIFLICFSPYHMILLVRTLLERDCTFIAGLLPGNKYTSAGIECKNLWLWVLLLLLFSRNIQLLPPVVAVDQPELPCWPCSLLFCERKRPPRTLQSVQTCCQDTILLLSPRQCQLRQARHWVARSRHRGEQQPSDCDAAHTHRHCQRHQNRHNWKKHHLVVRDCWKQHREESS